MAARSTLLDTLPSAQSMPRMLTVHPAIGDTSALISEVMMSVRTSRPSPLLIAMNVGVVRMHAGQHVWAEVPRVLSDLADNGRLDRQAAEELWWSEYVPMIRVVDTGGLPSSPSAISLAERDPSDVPTARLRDLLAPIVVLASDDDLIATGLAHETWWRAVDAALPVATAGGSVYLGLHAAILAGHGVIATTRAILRWLRDPWVQCAVLAAGLGLAITRDHWQPALRHRTEHVRSRIRDTSEAGWELIESLGAQLRSAFDAWDHAITGIAGESLAHAVAHVLCRTGPATRRGIAESLWPGASESELRRHTSTLRSELEGCSAFFEVSRGRWQCGRAGADFAYVPRSDARATALLTGRVAAQRDTVSHGS